MEKYINNFSYFYQRRAKSNIKIRRPYFNINNKINKNIAKNFKLKKAINFSYNNSNSNINNEKINQTITPKTVYLKTEYTPTINIPSQKLNLNINKKLRKNRTISVKKRVSHISDSDKKKTLRGKLRYLVKNNIILCEKKFNPRSFTESISNTHIKEYKNRFKNINTRNKVGIFTNKYPSILNNGNKFYTRYFDYFISPDELLKNNFNKNEIFQIKTEPNYFNFGNNFNYVSFFKKKTLKEILDEEDKIGTNKVMDVSLKKSLRQTKKRIDGYLNYYTSVMSRQGFIGGN